jgi:hypothetical protein
MSNTPRPPGPGTPLQAPPPSRGTRAPRLPTPPHRSRPHEAQQAGYPDDSEHGILTRVDFVGKLGRARRRESSSLKIFGSAAPVFRYLVALGGRNKKGGTQARRFFELLNTPTAALGVLVLAVAVNAFLFFGS